MSLGSIESIGNAIHNYYFGRESMEHLSSRLVTAAGISAVSLVCAGATYVNATLVRVKNPKGMILGSLGLGFSMPIMSLVTAL